MDQSVALNILKSGLNVYLCGSAGTGKSYTVNKYIEYLKKNKIRFAITASTGIAASHFEGVTIHSWSGIGVRDSLTEIDLEKIKQKKKLISETAVLIIDEISMLHSKQWEMLNQVTKYCRGNDKPFGGLQIVVCGDFFQLPPVEKNNESGNKKFCFMSPSWLEADFKICYLTKQYRQNNDVLTTILNEIRDGNVSEHSLELLKNTKDNDLGDGDITKLYTHNIDVDRVNSEQLKLVKGKKYSYKYELNGIPALADMIARQSRILEFFEYKIGALVLFTKNNEESGYCNGTTGIVVNTYEDDEYGVIPVVKLRNGEQVIVKPESWAILNDDGEEAASVVQIPLKLAWSITVHKSQGMTLDSAEIDLSAAFDSGSGFVALSRLRSLSGMRVLGMNDMATKIVPIVRKADSRFRELSEINEVQYAKYKFSEDHKKFISFCKENKFVIKKGEGGRFTRKRKSEKALSINKSEVTELSRGAIESIEKMLSTKGISPTTLIRNIQSICQKNKDIDLSGLRPKDEVLVAVSQAIRSYRDRGNTKPLYKNPTAFILHNVRLFHTKPLDEIEVWVSFLFINENGDIKL
ncbi:AAA family ATPase [Acinetobacter sp. ANC 5380]|uniref:AAA family ATPase n=1 Tax=Acinetobacter terrae TaxID=2731247 RepID=A0A7Y2RF68_9GAMM|nr:PIF1 family DEAD/DEAH box helicase [Acinetobacter terrae]NNH77394.1 AAA family ATPase [Acinetobacter terrae]